MNYFIATDDEFFAENNFSGDNRIYQSKGCYNEHLCTVKDGWRALFTANSKFDTFTAFKCWYLCNAGTIYIIDNEGHKVSYINFLKAIKAHQKGESHLRYDCKCYCDICGVEWTNDG